MNHRLHSGTSDNPNRIDGPSISPVPETAERPFWSVMIPTYNPNLNYLEQSLGSVLEQAPAARHMQIELIDDGSRNFDPQPFLHNIVGSPGRVSHQAGSDLSY